MKALKKFFSCIVRTTTRTKDETRTEEQKKWDKEVYIELLRSRKSSHSASWT